MMMSTQSPETSIGVGNDDDDIDDDDMDVMKP